jgi:tRNA-Thr(GGU) m(6)t(6)A37 methyltransferase TsaA
MEKSRREEERVTYTPIGVIHTEYTEQDETPIQGIFNPSIGLVEVFPAYATGLEEIESFSHLYLIYHFHKADGYSLVQKPFLDGERERGIFAIRHFSRPNPIGISIVELLEVRGNVLVVRGVDMLNGTPLLDIKPYVRQFDHRENVRSGWVDRQRMDDITGWNSSPRALRDKKRTNL